MGESPGMTDSSSMRRLGWIAYGAQGTALFLYIIALWLEVYVDTRKVPEAHAGLFYESHRRWRLRTSFIFLIWTILSGLAIPFGGIGWPVLVLTYAWYAVRVVIGLIYWQRGRPIGVRGRQKPSRGQGQDHRSQDHRSVASYITREY